MMAESYLRSPLRKIPFTVSITPPGCGATDATLALSVYNILSDAKRDLLEHTIREVLARPEIWDPRITLSDVKRGVDYLVKKGWVRAVDVTPGIRLAVLLERHPTKLTGHELKRDPMDPNYDNLIELASFQ